MIELARFRDTQFRYNAHKVYLIIITAKDSWYSVGFVYLKITSIYRYNTITSNDIYLWIT